MATPMKVVALLLLGVGLHQAGAADTASARPTTEALWADLGSAEESKAARALLGLAADPKATVAFLKENLRPVKADADRVTKLVKDLDSNEFAVRQKAMEELEYYGKTVKDQLEKAAKTELSAEAKQRVQQLLDKLPKKLDVKAPPPPPLPGVNRVQVAIINGKVIVNGQPVDGNPQPAPVAVGPSMTWVRAARAVALLEHLNTPEARQLLEAISQGDAEALPTTEAKAALERLKK